ncbi:MAG: hypothetical protein ACU0FH_08710 [Heliomarina sp.]|uniref:hypothetical protein n=1 Tax=Heliomarina sp. TaxID=2917556 RepID=UPI0040587E44
MNEVASDGKYWNQTFLGNVMTTMRPCDLMEQLGVPCKSMMEMVRGTYEPYFICG